MIKQILHRDWLPEGLDRDNLTRSGLVATFWKKMAFIKYMPYCESFVGLERLDIGFPFWGRLRKKTPFKLVAMQPFWPKKIAQ